MNGLWKVNQDRLNFRITNEMEMTAKYAASNLRRWESWLERFKVRKERKDRNDQT
jgi:hypothetical protein